MGASWFGCMRGNARWSHWTASVRLPPSCRAGFPEHASGAGYGKQAALAFALAHALGRPAVETDLPQTALTRLTGEASVHATRNAQRHGNPLEPHPPGLPRPTRRQRGSADHATAAVRIWPAPLGKPSRRLQHWTRSSRDLCHSDRFRGRRACRCTRQRDGSDTRMQKPPN